LTIFPAGLRQMSVQDILLHPAIVAAFISVAISSAISLIIAFYVEPRRWRRDTCVRNLEERLRYAYGPLHSIIHPKFTNPTSRDLQFLLKSKGEEETIHEIFRAFPHLIEERTWEEWNRIFSPPTAFGEVYVGLERTEMGLLIGGVQEMLDWLRMIESDYEAVVTEYHKVVGA